MKIHASAIPYNVGPHLAPLSQRTGRARLSWSTASIKLAVQPHQLAQWQVTRITTHVEEHLENTILTLELAKLACLSVFHFTRVFRNTIGCSPHIYVMRRRVARAQALMTSTDTCLAQIASLCGMSDQAHLNRRFRQFTGETPGAWRRLHRESARVLLRTSQAPFTGDAAHG
jgi:transcriptional regulator GlxA family with amidase domain